MVRTYREKTGDNFRPRSLYWEPPGRRKLRKSNSTWNDGILASMGKEHISDEDFDGSKIKKK